MPSNSNAPVKLRASNAKRHTRLRVIADLQPFLPLLPDISDLDFKSQEILFRTLFSAGVTASISLHKWLTVASGASVSVNFAKSSCIRNDKMVYNNGETSSEHCDESCTPVHNVPFGPEDAEGLKTLSRTGLLDDAVEALRQIPMVREDLSGLKDEDVAAAALITPEIAAAALTAFAWATARRPSTRSVEGLMASSNDPGATTGGRDSADDESVELNFSDSEDCDHNGDSLLGLACSAGYTELAKQLVKLKGDASYSGSKNDCTPLMEACSAGHVEIVEHLLQKGADVDAMSATQNTALIYAAAAGHLDCVKVLLKYNAKIDIRNDNGHCALMEAASSGFVDVVKVLLEASPTTAAAANPSDFKVGLESPLTLAAYKGHLEIVSYLLEKMGDCRNQEELHTALMEASMDGHLEVAKLLLDNGAPVNLASDSFESPLTLAACGGHCKLVEQLLDRGAELEEPNDEGYTPLMEASREGHRDVVEVLLRRGANINAQTEETGETALTLAACGAFIDVVKTLVMRGADLSLGANTPLMEAAQEGHLETVNYILSEYRAENGRYDVDAVTATNDTALTYAAENGHLDVCSALIEYGANVDHEAEGGRTALMKAAKNGNYSVVQFLILRKAKVNKVTANNDANALSLACTSGHWEIVRLLLDHGADPCHLLKDGTSCIIEASRNGHTRVVETLLNWFGVPASPRAVSQTAAKSSLQGNRVKKVARRGASKKATATTQPKIECAEKSVNASNNSKQESNNFEAASFTSSPDVAPHTPFKLDASTDSSVPNDATHPYPPSSPLSVANVSSHPLTHYHQPAFISTEELRGIIAGMAAMAAQSNSVPSDKVIAQIAQKAIRGTFGPLTNSECLSESKGQQHFTEMLKQQFSALAGRQKDSLGSSYSTSADSVAEPGGGDTSCTGSVTSSPSPPTVACCETTAAHVSLLLPLDHSSVSSNGKRRSSTSLNEVTKASVKNSQQKRFLKGCGVDGNFEVPCTPPPGTSLKFPVPPHPSSSVNTTRDNFTIPSPKMLKQTITATAALIRSKITPITNPDEVNSEEGNTPPLSRSRRTLSESAVQDEHQGTRVVETLICGDMETDDESTTEEHGPIREHQTDVFDVNMQTESNHDTALTLAATGGHEQLVDLLIARGADIEHRDKKGFTPLILAATGGHVSVVELLLNAGAQIEAQSERTKDTALSLACSGGRKEVVELLLKRGANKEHRNVSDYTPLSLAASGGYVDIVNMLLNAGAEINSRTGSKLGISPLMLAAMNGHSAATRLLLERGSDINAHIETNRNTALTLACFQGRTEVVRLLLEYNANVEHRAKTGLTPLMEAANGGYVDVAEKLLNHGADPNAAPVPASRDTALTIAADKGHNKFVELLLHRGAQIDARNKKGCTALWLACNGGHLDTVQILVKHEADPDAQDNRRVSPLIIAFRKGHLKVVKYMVRHVQQFPGDQECYRYIATLNEKDLLARCHQCMEVIVSAKERQAAQANKNAETLLEIIAKEEARAKSKKLSKQRQNEKKKAKRKAKKNIADSKEESSRITPEAEEQSVALDEGRDTLDEDGDNEKEEVNETIASSAAAATADAAASDIDAKESLGEAIRVPAVIRTESSTTAAVTKNVSSHAFFHRQSIHSGTQKTPRNHNKGDGGSTGKSGQSSVVALSRPPLKTNSSETEWMKAKSRRNAAARVNASGKNNGKEESVVSRHELSSKSRMYITSLPSKEDPNNLLPWHHIVTARRRSSRLAVSSNLIARVIGRAGGNINAIREATGAYIEVEKQNGKKEQHDRQITIKGSEHSIRQAVEMINGLILDSEATVNEIVKRVTAAGGASTAGSHTDDTPYSRHSMTNDVAASKLSKPAPPSLSHTANEVPVKIAVVPQATQNVWVQRAAQRQKAVSAIGSEKKQKQIVLGPNSSADTSALTATPLTQLSVNVSQTDQESINGNVLQEGNEAFQLNAERDDAIKANTKGFCRTPGHSRSASVSASSSSVSPTNFSPLPRQLNNFVEFPVTGKSEQLPNRMQFNAQVRSDVEVSLPKETDDTFDEIGSLIAKEVEAPSFSNPHFTANTEDSLFLNGPGRNGSTMEGQIFLSDIWGEYDPMSLTRSSEAWNRKTTASVATAVTTSTGTMVTAGAGEAPHQLLNHSNFAEQSTGFGNSNVFCMNMQLPIRSATGNSEITQRGEGLELARNLAQLRVEAHSGTGSLADEENSIRGFGGEAASTSGCSVGEVGRGGNDWVRNSYNIDNSQQWRNDDQKTGAGVNTPAASLFTVLENHDSNMWINHAAAQLAGTIGHGERVPLNDNYVHPFSHFHAVHNCGAPTHAVGDNLGQFNRHLSRQWDSVQLQQAAQAASQEYDHLNVLLNSYRPFNPVSSTTTLSSGNSHLRVDNDYTNQMNQFHSSQNTVNTSVPPPPPFFNAHIPPPRAAVHQSASNTSLFTTASLSTTSNYGPAVSSAVASTCDGALFSHPGARTQWSNYGVWQ